MGVLDATFFGFPVGSRGKWILQNFELLKRIGLSSSRKMQFAQLISRKALLYSIEAIYTFVNSDWKLGVGVFLGGGNWFLCVCVCTLFMLSFTPIQCAIL